MSDDERRGPPGGGTIDRLPSGRWRVRMRLASNRRKTATFDTEAEAEGFRNAMLSKLARAGEAPVGGATVRAYGERWLDAREVSGCHRAIKTERSLWRTHLAPAAFADWPLANVTKADVRAWARSLERKRALAPRRAKGGGTTHAKTDRFLSWQARRYALVLLRQLFEAAIEDGLVADNPAAGVSGKKPAGADEDWTFLTLEEIAAVAGEGGAIPEAERVAFTVAIYSGLRQGEMLGLHWVDVHLEGERPHAFVRFSHRGRPKNGRTRVVPLLGPARDALARWKRVCPRSDEGLVFPTARGCRRQRGDDFGWADTHVPRAELERLRAKGLSPSPTRPGWKARAGIARAVRFHDLRHTCASHLVMGSWGAKWSLSEIAAMLGHRDTGVTERYAHLGEEHLHRLAAETARRDPPRGDGPGSRGSGGGGGIPRKVAGAPEKTRTSNPQIRSLSHCSAEAERYESRDPGVTREAAEAVVSLARAGQSIPGVLAETLIAGVLDEPAVRLALGLRDGPGPHDARRLIELADLVLAEGAGEGSAAADRGRRG